MSRKLITWDTREEHEWRGYLDSDPDTTLFLIVPANPQGDVRLLGWCVPTTDERERVFDVFSAQLAAETYMLEWFTATTARLFGTPAGEVSPPAFTETLPDGRVVGLHAPGGLQEQTRNAIAAIHTWTDVKVAEQVSDGGFHPGTALAVMMLYRDAVRALDATLAERITPTKTELAVSARPMVLPLPTEPVI